MLLFPVAFLMPDCDCCGTCGILTDDFSGGLGEWNQVSGSWVTTNNRLSVPTGSAVILADGVTTDANGARVTFNAFGGDGDVWNVILGRVDANNYTYVRIRFGPTSFFVQSGYLSAYRVVAGVGTALAMRTPAGTYTTDPSTGDPAVLLSLNTSQFIVCFDDCELRVTQGSGTTTFI